MTAQELELRAVKSQADSARLKVQELKDEVEAGARLEQDGTRRWMDCCLGWTGIAPGGYRVLGCCHSDGPDDGSLAPALGKPLCCVCVCVVVGGEGGPSCS